MGRSRLVLCVMALGLGLPATGDDMASLPPLPSDQAVDREPVWGRNKPYAPADGATVRLNPPPFLWLPSGRDVRYRLQVARNDHFEGVELRAFADLEWCCEMLTEPLGEGTWYWRYGVDRRGGLPTIWSRARRFEVPAGAAPWAYPGRDSFRVPQARPHLFLHPDRLPELRQRARDGDLKVIADGLLANVRKHLGEELVPEPAMLPADPAERGPAYTITFRTTRPPMDLMEQAGLAYLLTGDAEAGAEAKRRLLHFFSWDPHGSTGIFHNDEPAMWVMMRGTRAYDWTYDLFTAAERAIVETAMHERAADFYRQLRSMPFDNNPYSSHPGRTIGFLGEAAIEFLNDWPEARHWLDYISHIYWGVYPAWGEDDGGWNEGPGYWSAYMSFALHFVVALREATGVDLAQRPFFRHTPYYKLYVSPPWSQMSPFGDGQQWRPSRPTGLMYWFSSLTGDPVLRWYPDSLGKEADASILGVVLKDDSLAARPPVDLPQARLFEGVGLACLHTNLADGADDVYFAMRSSPYGAVSHGHNDQNCFVLEAYGEPLAIATGYYNRYGSPHHDGWTRQTKAKCGITFDGGQGQDRGWQAQGRITSFVHGEAFDLVTGDATAAYGGRLTRAIREVVHVRPGLFVIRDDLASDQPRRYEAWLHAIDRMEVDEAGAKVVIRRPRASLTAVFFYPQGLELSQTDHFDPPPTWPPEVKYDNHWHLTATVAEPAKEAELVTLLLPAEAGKEHELPTASAPQSGTARGVELRFGDGTRVLVAFAKAGVQGEVTLGEASSDGRVFAVRCNPEGKPTGWLLDGGTRLSWNGVELARRTAPGTATGTEPRLTP